MESGIKLGRVFGVPIYLDFSWFLIAVLITFSLATGYFPGAYPHQATLFYIILGATTAVLFAASVLLHEFGHVLLALREHISVRSVTLFIFGGVARINEEPRSAGAEFRIAIAGPLVSFALAGFFGLLWLMLKPIAFLAAPSEYLMRINFILAAFNLIPGFPLDGGRVLRAIIWKVTGNMSTATRAASITGQIVAFGFIAFGAVSVFTGNFFNGLWLVFIGWFLHNAASSAYQQSQLQQAMRGVTVSQVMKYDFEPVSPLTSLDRVVEERILGTGQRNFMVIENGQVQGIITLEKLSTIPQRQWPFTTARQAMIPVDRLDGIPPYMELMTALQKMENERRNQLAVVQGSQLLGMLNLEDVLRYVRVRSKFGI
jgi:Zn-dependent protease